MSAYKISDVTNCTPVNLDFNGISMDVTLAGHTIDFEDGNNWGFFLCDKELFEWIKNIVKEKRNIDIPEFGPDVIDDLKEKEKIENNEMEYDGFQIGKQEMEFDGDEETDSESEEPSPTAAVAAVGVGSGTARFVDFGLIKKERLEKERRIEMHNVCKRINELIGGLCSDWTERNEFEMVRYQIGNFVDKKLRILFNHGQKGDILKYGRKVGLHQASLDEKMNRIFAEALQSAEDANYYDEERKRVEKMRKAQNGTVYTDDEFWKAIAEIDNANK